MHDEHRNATKSSRTRSAILIAARRLFFERGYEGATVRKIAQAVPIDPSMVIRYFGSKERLFAAATVVDLQFPDPGSLNREEIGKTLTEHFLDLWEDEKRDQGLAILLRSAAQNEEMRADIHDVFARQVVPMVTRINPIDAERRAGLIVSQLFGLALCRYILQLPPIAAMSRNEVIESLGPTIQRYAVDAMPDTSK
ncbi:TetR family transcriptional regulator [Notoacmeibacter ruber]|uniref:TetR/AcrR family transcriptional regulator n=1 Tax=Notoacmeibacter ruber TaxID=2670375 RepID=A0A3L7JEY6_9HYPH|nr:TetR family transcriptional regulator [Notoacmeibacter ruber]RLQ89236.1 TetR/AcrR family transcriptional regulator [Notoacmeibacter ruber]